MKLEINNRYDQKGFWLRSKLIRVSFHFWELQRSKLQKGEKGMTWTKQRSQWGWKFQIDFGRGAGYIWGRSFYIGWRTKGGILWSANPKPPRILRMNFTQNGNAIPYGFHTY